MGSSVLFPQCKYIWRLFFVWLKETNLQINRLPHTRAASSDRHGARLGLWMTVAVLHRWQRIQRRAGPQPQRQFPFEQVKWTRRHENP